MIKTNGKHFFENYYYRISSSVLYFNFTFNQTNYQTTKVINFRFTFTHTEPYHKIMTI